MATVLNIGNCDADHMFLEAMLSSKFAASSLRAHRLADAQALLAEHQVDLILINRLLDGDGSEGMAVLKAIKSDAKTENIPVMLITNYAEHQAAAIEAGAVQGFGKAALNDEQTQKVIAAVIGE